MNDIRIRAQRPLLALCLLGLLLYIALPVHSDEPKSAAPTGTPSDPDKAKQISEIEKQISELSKKLEELKSAPVATAAPANGAPPEGTIPESWAQALSWRCIGPANMGGRITSISVFEEDPSTYWVATASGGLLKTTNNGITFEHQFDRENTVSIGDVCVAPSNRDIIYVGTGEANPRNSVSYGDGVYKSTDGGKTWTNVGLNKSFQIGKILVHPKDPNIVYVGALGRLWGPNEERGLFKSTDGGKTWRKILYVDDRTGVIDMRMSPADPNTLIVATWERKRDEYDGYFDNPPVPDQYGPVVTHAPGTALYKTTDGGENFRKLTNGLPTVKMGRIGLDWSRKNPNVVYAIIDTEKSGTGVPPSQVYMGIQGEDASPGAKLVVITQESPAEKAGLKAGDVIVRFDGKDVGSYDVLLDLIRQKKVGDKVKVSIKREGKDQEIEVTLGARPTESARGGQGGGGRGFGGPRVMAGFRADDVKEGLQVTAVLDESPAAKAGLKVDDIVTEVDGKPAPEFREFVMTTAQEKKAGDKMKLTVLRGKDKPEKLEITLTLAEMDMAGLMGAGRGGPSRNRPYATTLGGQQANVQDQQGKDGWQTGGIYRSDDAGETWKRVNSLNPRPMYFSKIRVDPTDDNNIYVLGVSFAYSTDGGKRFRSGKDRGVHSDHHALWIDPRDGRHMIIGTDGGFYVSYDRGETWDHHNFQALGQFYHVAIDPRPNYRVYGGLQDNGSWGGPSISPRGGIVNEDWVYINGGDGFVCRVDPTDPDLVYAESQGGAMTRRNFRTGERAFIRPRVSARGPRHRFNWNTPYILSNHNPSIFYCMGEVVFRSVNKGDNLKVISPELTRTKMGSGTALSESPRNPDVLWAGTDDGNLWVTRDGGVTWTNVIDNVKKAGLPGYRWVATIEASRYADGRCYVCFDAHRSDDDNPYLFVTEDFGATWKNITANLPWGSTRCLREDIKNQDVLYCGTEFGIWASVNRGASWTNINNKSSRTAGLPTVAIHEIAQHPITGELVVATHGRSVWICDISAIRQINKETIAAKAHLYAPNPAIRWRVEANRGMFSGAERKFVGSNPPRGAAIYYSLNKPAEKVELKIVDINGQVIRRLDAKKDPGLHRVLWDFSRLPNLTGGTGGVTGRGPGSFTGRGGGARGQAGGASRGQAGAAAAASGQREPASGPPMAGEGIPQQRVAESAETPTAPTPGLGRGFAGGAQVAAGTYRVILTVDGQEYTATVRVDNDPTQPIGTLSVDADEEPEGDDEPDERIPARADG
jgi:photosystem II stability/assembly factor-like uncharacterized protein